MARVSIAAGERATRRPQLPIDPNSDRDAARVRERFRHVTEYSLDLICETTLDGRFSYVSPNYERILGYRPEELLGISVFTHCHPDDRAGVIEEFFRTFAGLTEGRATFRYRAKSGEWRWLEGVGRAFLAHNGPRGIIISRDATARVNAEARMRALEAEERRMVEYVQQTPVAFIAWDEHGRATAWNPAAERMFGLTHAAAIGAPGSELVAPADRAVDVGWIYRYDADRPEHHQQTIAHLRPDGTIVECEWTSRPAFDGDGRLTGMISAANDVTQQRRAQAELAYLTHHDPRTRLPNRLMLDKRVSGALEVASLAGPFALLVCGIDRFKLFTERRGEAFGDALLRESALRLQSAIGPADTLASVGSGRFAILAPGVRDAAAAQIYAELLLEVFRSPMTVVSAEIVATLSIGVAMHPVDGAEPAALIEAAEFAMQRAQHAGRDRLVHATAPARHDHVVRIDEPTLQAAIAAREFIVYYQPIVSAGSGLLTSFEALVRWPHKTHGLLQPAEFIPLAERSGLVVDLGLLVLRSACLQLREWRRAGFEVPRIAVNVSSQQFWSDDLVERITEILLECGLTGADLELELTETTAMQDLESIEPLFHALRGIGVHISIDDFGTGYSSLAYLRAFPIQRLKIDRSFIDGAEDDADRANIVRTIVTLGHGLGLRVVAEGVETQAQAAFARDAGCDELQGYLFARPLNVASCEVYLETDARLPHEQRKGSVR